MRPGLLVKLVGLEGLYSAPPPGKSKGSSANIFENSSSSADKSFGPASSGSSTGVTAFSGLAVVGATPPVGGGGGPRAPPLAPGGGGPPRGNPVGGAGGSDGLPVRAGGGACGAAFPGF